MPGDGIVASQLFIRSAEDANLHLASVHDAAARTYAWIRAHSGSSLELLRSMKFEAVGFHPVSGAPLNLIEQTNQTWTFIVAIAAAEQLLALHPDAGGFHLAPGAHASLPFDIVSGDGTVVAETFAAVTPAKRQAAQGYGQACTRTGQPSPFRVFRVARLSWQ